MDGTLIDSRKDIVSAVNYTIKQFGQSELPSHEIEPYLGTGVQPLIEKLVGIANFKTGFDLFRDYYMSRCCQETELYPGIPEVLDFYSDLPKVILTNKTNEFVEPILEGLAIGQHFLEWYGRHSFETRKPDPGPLLAISKKFNIEPSKVLMIGDTDVDITAGKRAGTQTCRVLYGYGKVSENSNLNADYTVSDPLELMSLG